MTERVHTQSEAAQIAPLDATQAAPIAAKDRISSLDFIRGIAVMGILAANIIAFGQPLMATMQPNAWLSAEGDPNHYWWLGQFVLIDGKMRGLFSLLFGAGLWLFVERAQARGSTLALAIRRLVILGLFGLFHFYFIWVGDILFLYAVCGLVMLGFLAMKPANQIILGLLAFGMSAVFFSMATGGLYWLASSGAMGEAEAAEMYAQMSAGFAEVTQKSKAIIVGDYPAFVAANFTENLWMPISTLLTVATETIGLMLIGMGAIRIGFFEGELDRRKILIFGWSALLLGGVGTYALGYWVILTEFDVLASLFAYIGASAFPRLLMIGGLAALLVSYSPLWTGWFGQRVSAAGRAAFTNYLGTSMLMLFVFHGWALGLYGELTRPELYAITLACWIVMLAWSKPWLDQFRYGPLEWLWRCMTYGKKFELRR